MSFLDKIKDVLTTDDEEKAQKAHEVALEAEKKAAEAAKQAQEAKSHADAAAHKAGLPTDDDAAKAAAAEHAKTVEAAAEAKRHADVAAAEAQKVKAEHDAFVATQAAEAKAAHAAEEAAAAKANKPKPLRTYTVVRGDTLSGIGSKFHVSWHEIAEINHIRNPDLIHPGQVFKIPHS